MRDMAVCSQGSCGTLIHVHFSYMFMYNVHYTRVEYIVLVFSTFLHHIVHVFPESEVERGGGEGGGEGEGKGRVGGATATALFPCLVYSPGKITWIFDLLIRASSLYITLCLSSVCTVVLPYTLIL